MKRRVLRILLWSVPVISIAGVVAIAWYQRERSISFLSDAASIRAPLEGVTPRDILWTPSVRLPDVLNTRGNEFEPALSRDGQTMYFVRGRAAHNADIFVATKTPTGWSEPAPLAGINTEADEMGPEPSPDGRAIYFHSDRGGGRGGYDLWVSSRAADGGWLEPVNLGPAVNSARHDYGPCLSPDGRTLYFASDRPAPDETVPDDASVVVEGRDFDLYAAAVGDGEFGRAAPVESLNSPSNEAAPAVSESGDFIYFSSDRAGGLGGFDLYRARIVRGGVGAPANLGESINTAANELDPALTLGGFGIHFSSDRSRDEGIEPASGAGLYDLYYAQSREVFVETETWRARIDWAALLALLLPYLIWLLLTLLTMGVLAAILRRLEYNRMGLLMKCMVGSLIAHLLLLLLLTLWGVSTQLSESLAPGTAMRVVITLPSVGSGIAEQIRGELTDVEIDAEQELALQQTVETEIDQPARSEAEVAVEQTAIESFESLQAEQAMREALAAALDAPDPQPVSPSEAPALVEQPPLEQASREQMAEAVARVPEQAVSSPEATRAADEALPRPEKTFDTQVTLNVERAEAMNDAAASLAERSATEDARAASSATLMEVAPRPVQAASAEDLAVATAPVLRSAAAPEAQAQVAEARPDAQRQMQATAVNVTDAATAQVALAAPRTQEQLAMHSLARAADAQAATSVPLTAPTPATDAAPQARSSDVAIRQMPQLAAANQSERQRTLEVAVAPAGRTDASDAYEYSGAPAQQIAVVPEAARLVASDSLAASVTMSEAATKASPLPEMHARVSQDQAATSDLPLTTPARDVQASSAVAEASSATTIRETGIARLDSMAVAPPTTSTETAEVHMHSDAAPLAVAAGTLVETTVNDRSAAAATDVAPPLNTSTAMTDQAAAPVSVPAEVAEGPALEAELSAATALTQATGPPAPARASAAADMQVETGDVQVTMSPASAPMAIGAASLAKADGRESSVAHEPPMTNSASRLDVGELAAARVDIPLDLTAGEADSASGRERTALPIAASATTSRAESIVEPARTDATAPVRTDVAQSRTDLQDVATASLAQSNERDAARPATSVTGAAMSPLPPAAAAGSLALHLPDELDQPADGDRSMATGQVDPTRLAESASARYSPRESPVLEPAVAAVMVNPSRTARESSGRRLLDDVRATDDGVTPDLNPPATAREFTEGLVIPPLAAVRVSGMEETAASGAGREESADQLAAESRSHDRARFDGAFPASPSRHVEGRILASLPPALGPVVIGQERLFAATDRAGDAAGAPFSAAMFEPDIHRPAAAVATADLDLRLPMEQHAPLNPYTQRSEDVRAAMIDIMGGSQETEQAVKLALDWLARHQGPDGSWDGDQFDDRCGECAGRAKVQVDIGLTGLSLLCFLAADHTHLKEGPYQQTVTRGLRWLLRKQHQVGSLITDESMYSHGIATIALAEAYGMTGDPELADPVQRAIDFIYSARNRGVGGWRYGPGQVGDTSVLGWQIMALKSADRAGINVPRDAFEVGRRWLDLVAQSTPLGQYRYQPDGEVTPAMTAEGLFVRQLLGAERDEAHVRASVEYILDRLPDWESECNVYYWYYATLAMFQHQGEAWETWNQRVTAELLARQYTSGRAAGSWDPACRWANIGGRVYQTAISTLILEVYYRYLPTFVGDASAPARSAITGRVTDASTGAAIPGASVRLDLGAERSVTARADEIGQYTLLVPDVPDHIAVSASHPGYTPESISVGTDEIKRQTIVRDFALRPEVGDVIAVERAPEVHHLGNNEFTGRINSQFQKESEGLIYEHAITLDAAQLAGAVGFAQVRMLVRGAQADNAITVNGRTVSRRINQAPADGSFGEFTARFPVEWLVEGRNLITIESVRGDFDLDDFEFVNVRIVLNPRDGD